jgi:hypothetical protein
MSYTLSYDEKVNGWVSFFSYQPEMMVNLNNDMYSFKSGQLYIHEQETLNRNSFYGQPSAPTTVEFIMNASPSEVKIFKTIELEGSSCAWDVEIDTNLISGHIDKESFKDKEGICYEYIKRNEEDMLDTKLLSVQGVGEVSSVSGTIIYFTSVPNNINVGDSLYYQVIGTPVKVGTITAVTSTSVSVGSVLSSPSVGSFAFAAKSSVAESYGLKGYYASVKLTNEDAGPVELFAVNSEIIKSFP